MSRYHIEAEFDCDDGVIFEGCFDTVLDLLDSYGPTGNVEMNSHKVVDQ